MTDIVDDLLDLHKQATTERSHYYVAATAERAIAEIKCLRSTLDATHKLVSEGAKVGFVPTEGTWAERLFANQWHLHTALNR